MNYRKQTDSTPELAEWYDSKYTEMGGTWVTPAEECNRHLDDLGVPFDTTKTLLDVGCGGGHFLAEAEKRVSCTGLEISDVAVQFASGRARGSSILPFSIETFSNRPTDGFDYIVSMGSLEHIVNLDQALDNIRRLLAPGGRWYFYCPNEKWVHQDQPNERTMTDSEWMALFRAHDLYALKATSWGDNTAFMGCKEPAAPPEVVAWAGERVQLNIGSGQRPFPKPWINIDAQAKWQPDIVADGACLPMIQDGQAQCIVLHQVLEHYGCGESGGLIRECHRILRPGGSLLVFVPDMKALAKAWLAGYITTQVYLTNVYGAYMGDEADRHKWGFTADTITPFLSQAVEWVQVKRFDWREIEGASLACDWWVLTMECVK